MTDVRKERKGVVLPEISDAKRRVNEKLIKIKEEMFLEQHCDGTSYTELSFEYSQPIRPKRFYADLEESMDGLNRNDCTKEMLRLCHTDHSKLLDYRDRLAKRAQALPNCPQTRLVNTHKKMHKRLLHFICIQPRCAQQGNFRDFHKREHA